MNTPNDPKGADGALKTPIGFTCNGKTLIDYVDSYCTVKILIL